jgi:O-antigen ligase
VRLLPRASTPPDALWMAFAAVVAVMVGLASATNATIAFAIAVGLALPVLFLRNPPLLLAVLAASPFVEAVSLGGVTISRLLAPVALLAIVAASVRPAFRIRADEPLLWASAYVLWAVASALWSVRIQGTTSLLASLGISVTYMFAFASLLATRRDLDRLLYAVAFAALGVGLYAIASFFLHISAGLLQGRAIGGSEDPNFFAAYQIVALPLVLALAGQAADRRLRTILYCTLLVIVASILASASRGGLLGLAAMIVLLVYFRAGVIFRSRRQKSIVLLALVGATAVALQAASSIVLPRITSLFNETSSAAAEGSGRKEVWRSAEMSIAERPLLGLGYGAFEGVSNDLLVRTPNIQFTHFELRLKGLRVHNAYLSSMAELGLPGLILFVGLLVSTLRALRRTARRGRELGDAPLARVANAFVLSLIGWCVTSIFLSSETSRGLWIVVGISLALPRLLSAASETSRDVAPSVVTDRLRRADGAGAAAPTV